MNLETIQARAMAVVAEQAKDLEKIALFNTQKVLRAFRNQQVADFYMKPSNGYAYNDMGREKLDAIFAEIFHTEAALVRSQFVSGTHALAVALLGNLQPGDELVALTGTPYDTMKTIMEYLKTQNIVYKEIPMTGSEPDFAAIKRVVTPKTKMVHIQRSCGYSAVRNTLHIEEIAEIIKVVKSISPEIICYVDNCYGEFAQMQEPTEVGADIVAGSLIKNLGGGIAPTGGYIAGRADLVENASYRLTVPGLGGEMGAVLGDTAREFYEGLFLAPHVVMQAIKTSIYAGAVFQGLGYQVKPLPETRRSDIIQCISLGTKDKLCKFCQAIQANSPVDAHVKPIPSPLPGYADEIIMAAGTFVQGASIELSADGPIREPFNVFMQGGLTFEHGILAVNAAAELIGKCCN